ncbi:Enterobactin exporter EntS [Sutcliffiella rhizosphaerae]|uniref:Enterobactin exporter EntS n=1 Tax=Sutcliffiella rhizosphaerae TaxID=2880967 RepID=A0ABN8ABT6_9BACI|nr:Enterobactin exporter EntS [Sutcliffiella rhizosphaerae]
MWLLYFIPSIILQLFIGPIIDVWDRKWTMIVSQWVRGAFFLLPLAAFATGDLQVWHIYAVQVVIGLITPIYTPANQAIVPSIVPKEQLKSANALLDGAVRLMTFMAPLLGGVVIELVGVFATLIFVCISLITSGIFLLFIKENREKVEQRSTWLAQFMEGITYFFTQRVIVWLGFFLAFVQFGVGVTMVVTLPYITDLLSGSYADYGLFMAGFPLGYIIGAMLVGKVAVKSRRGVLLGALVVGGITFILLGVNQSISVAIIIEIIAGISMAFFSIHNITLVQERVPNHLMGKVTSVRLFIIRCAMPLGVLAATVFSEWWGIRALYFFIGFVICAVSSLGILLPYFRFLDKEEGLNKMAS